MMSSMKLAAFCCALGTSATAPDAAGLMQKNVQVRMEEVAEPMDAPTFKINSRTVARSMVRMFLQDGRRWVQLLWGNKTRGLGPEPVPAQEDVAGCSEADHQMAEKRAMEIEDDVMNSMENMMPKIMKVAQKQMRNPFGGSDPDAMAAEIMGGSDLAKKVPPVCMTLLTSEDLHWADLGQCLQDVLKVSASCVNCIPQFGKEVGQACESTCEASMHTFSDRLDKAQEDLDVKMKKKMGPFSMPSQSDMMEVMGSLTTAVSEGMKDTVPCLKCFQPKARNFVKCMMDDEIAQAFDREFAETIEDLKNGKLVAEVVPMDGGMPMGSGLPAGKLGVPIPL